MHFQFLCFPITSSILTRQSPFNQNFCRGGGSRLPAYISKFPSLSKMSSKSSVHFCTTLDHYIIILFPSFLHGYWPNTAPLISCRLFSRYSLILFFDSFFSLFLLFFKFYSLFVLEIILNLCMLNFSISFVSNLIAWIWRARAQRMDTRCVGILPKFVSILAGRHRVRGQSFRLPQSTVKDTCRTTVITFGRSVVLTATDQM